MVESCTNKVIAVYKNGNIFSGRKSRSQINVNYGRDFDALVLLTGCAMLERADRDSRRSAGAAAVAGALLPAVDAKPTLCSLNLSQLSLRLKVTGMSLQSAIPLFYHRVIRVATIAQGYSCLIVN